jgi:hypothetical protein
MAKRKTKNSASNTGDAEPARKSTSDSTTTTCQTDTQEQHQKLNIKENPAGINGRPGQGSRSKREVSQSQSRMAVRENQSGKAGRPGTAARGSGREAKGLPIPVGRRQAKWFALAVIAIAFIAFIALSFPRTPASTKADEIDLLALKQELKRELKQELKQDQEKKQEQDISTPVVTEEAPLIEAISVTDNGESKIYVQGSFARVGDTVDGFKILKIDPNRVEFEKNGQTVVRVIPSDKN